MSSVTKLSAVILANTPLQAAAITEDITRGERLYIRKMQS